MIRVGLTGTIGAGKSMVAELFESWGAFRIDADRLARQAVRPGSPALASIARAFGERVLAEDGSLDRAVLRRLVFDDRRARALLERIVHPEVGRLRLERRAAAEARGAEILVEEIPLLLEKKLQGDFDAVVVVDAPVETRRERVTSSRGIGAEEFAAMDAAQWPGERKRAAADHVVWNDGDPETLERRARRVWEAIVGGADGRAAAEPAVWRIDLHLHTSASRDCRSEPADVVRRAREAGLDRIAVTDHDEIDGALAAREIAPELVIVGEEVRTAEGLDVIGLFLERHIAPGGDFRETAAAIREQGGVVYLPHPFDARRGGAEAFFDEVRDCIDVVEGLNARIHRESRNRRAREWAAARGLPVGGGSDAHLLVEVGRAGVRLPPFDGPVEFLESIAHGALEGRPSGWWVHLGSTWARWIDRLGIG